MDIHFIRKNLDFVKENQKKRFKDEILIDEIMELDTQWKTLVFENDNLKGIKNRLSLSFKNASKNQSVSIDFDEDLIQKLRTKLLAVESLTKEQLIFISKKIGEVIEGNESKLETLLKSRDEKISGVANVINEKVIISNDEMDNEIIEVVNNENVCTSTNNNTKKTGLLTHNELLERLGFVNYDQGLKICGNRGYFLTNFGVKLNMALLRYALDFMSKKAFELMDTPHFVNAEIMGKITQLSDYEETLYKIDGKDKFLIATSEQSITASFCNITLNKNYLPIKICGKSCCYRKETGAHGKKTTGLYRVHQFEKIEQFCLTEKKNSWQMFSEMLNNAKEFYDSLGISYRIVSIVSGQLNNSASMKYDLEGFFRGSNTYCELVSCTNCLDYFSNRINTKYGMNEYVHMLNCTLCANTRTLCCLAEAYQTEGGMIIPKVLRPYLDNIENVNFTR